jgi:trans-aconitate methyltransferase
MSAAQDDWNRHWQDYSETARQNPAQNYRRELILSLLGIEGAGEGMRIMDIGSGQGDMAAAVRARFPLAEILGLELSHSGVEVARRKVATARFVQRNLLIRWNHRTNSAGGQLIQSVPKSSSIWTIRVCC